MADKAESEETLGEKAPAGIPTWGPESKGLPGRGWDEEASRKGKQIEGIANPVPETDVETVPTEGTGGEPEVGKIKHNPDMSNPA